MNNLKPRIVSNRDGRWWVRLPGQPWFLAPSWPMALDFAFEWWRSGAVR